MGLDSRRIGTLLLAMILLGLPQAAGAALSREEMVKLLSVIDDRQRNGGDYKSLAYIEQKEKDKGYRPGGVRLPPLCRRQTDDPLHPPQSRIG